MKYVNLMGLDDIETEESYYTECKHFNLDDGECLDCGRVSKLIECPICNDITDDLNPCC